MLCFGERANKHDRQRLKQKPMPATLRTLSLPQELAGEITEKRNEMPWLIICQTLEIQVKECYTIKFQLSHKLPAPALVSPGKPRTTQLILAVCSLQNHHCFFKKRCQPLKCFITQQQLADTHDYTTYTSIQIFKIHAA